MERAKFRVRNESIKLRCTEYEKLEIERAASENNMNVNSYVLKMTLEGCVVNVDFSELKKLIYEVNRIGNNVNQIAYHANRDNAIYEDDIKEVKKQIDLLWALLRMELFSFK